MTDNVITKAESLDIWELFNQIYHLISRYRDMELRPINVSRSQVLILWLVQNLGDKATIAEIARSTYLQSHSISAIIKRMEKNDLLAKRLLPGTRTQVFHLTDKGKEAYVFTIKAKSIHKVISSLPVEDVKQLRFCLESLITTVKKEIAFAQSNYSNPSEFLPLFEESDEGE